MTTPLGFSFGRFVFKKSCCGCVLHLKNNVKNLKINLTRGAGRKQRGNLMVHLKNNVKNLKINLTNATCSRRN